MDMNVERAHSLASTQCASSDSEDEDGEILCVYQGPDHLERQVLPYLLESTVAAEAEEAAESHAATRAAAAAAHAEAERAAAERAVRLAVNAILLATVATAWEMQEQAKLRSLNEAVKVAYAAVADLFE